LSRKLPGRDAKARAVRPATARHGCRVEIVVERDLDLDDLRLGLGHVEETAPAEFGAIFTFFTA